jgi:hypothetical protein
MALTVKELIEKLETEPNKDKPVRILFEKADYADDYETIAEIDSVYEDDTINGEPTLTIICGEEVLYDGDASGDNGADKMVKN